MFSFTSSFITKQNFVQNNSSKRKNYGEVFQAYSDLSLRLLKKKSNAKSENTYKCFSEPMREVHTKTKSIKHEHGISEEDASIKNQKYQSEKDKNFEKLVAAVSTAVTKVVDQKLVNILNKSEVFGDVMGVDFPMKDNSFIEHTKVVEG